MSNKKYVIATIQIPMEISESGNYESLMDHVSVEFTHCLELPEKKADLNTSINSSYKNMLAGLFPSKNVENTVVLQKEPETIQEQFIDDLPFTLFVNSREILPKKRSKNTSFKQNRLGHHHSFTAKNRNSIE